MKSFLRRALFLALATLLTLPLISTPALAGLLGGKMGITEENELGRKFDELVRAQMPMIEDPLITTYVDDIVKKIVEAKAPMPFTIKSAVIRNESMNAFAIPGGFIYVFTGLIEKAHTEDELAGVIAHELGHVSQRHVASRLEKQSTLNIATTIASLAAIFIGGGSNVAQGVAISAAAASQAALLTYSQQDENEADHVGFNSMVKAGYNPIGMRDMFDTMLKLKWYGDSSGLPSYLSTHPGLSQRIGYLQDRIDRMPPQFSARITDYQKLHEVQMVIRAHYTPVELAQGYYADIPDKDKTALDFVGQGSVLYRLKKMSEAEPLFQHALTMAPGMPLILREAGIFFFQYGKYDKALPLLQQAAIRNPKDAVSLFYTARIQDESGDKQGALETMSRVLKQVPRDWEIHFHMGKILGELGNTFEAHKHLALSAIYSRDMRQVRFHMEKARQAAKTPEQEQELKEVEELSEKGKLS